MSFFQVRPPLRWLVPAAAAVAVIAGGAVTGAIVANAGPALPPRTAAQLLADLKSTKVVGMSGTLVETTDLGLPAARDMQLLTGSNTVRVWHTGQGRERLSLLNAQGETDIIRNGSDVWLWNSAGKKGYHAAVPSDLALLSLPQTPQEAADAAVAAMGRATAIAAGGTVQVAGRNAYELVLRPSDPGTLIGQVRLAIDATTHIPLRVDVYAGNAPIPAVRLAFQQISFAAPDPAEFSFIPPPGTAMTEGGTGWSKILVTKPQLTGTGWTSVLQARFPQKLGAVKELPAVSGSWGSGRLFTGTLLSVLIRDDGTVFAGAVTPAKLYEAAA